MADNKILLEFSDEAIKTSLDQAVNDLKKISKESKEAGKALNEGIGQGAKSIKDFNKGTQDAVKSANDLGNAVEDANKKFKESSNEIKNSIRNFSLFGVSVGDVENKFKSLAGIFAPLTNRMKGFLRYARDFRIFGTSIGEVATGLRGMASGALASNKAAKLLAGGFKLLKSALISTGIGALVVALGSVVAFLSKTQKGVDLFNRALGGLTAGVNVIIDRLSGFGEIIFKVFQGKAGISELAKGAKDAVSGLGQEIRDEVSEAARLVGVLQQLRDTQRELSVEYAQIRTRIKQLNLTAEDTTKTLKERSDAAREAIALERSIVEEQIQLIKDRLAAEEALVNQGKSKEEDLQKLADLRIELEAKIQESLELQTTLNNKLNTIEQERLRNQQAAAAAAAKAAEDYVKLVEQFEKLTQVDDDDPIVQLRKEYEQAKVEAEKLVDQIVKAGEEAGEVVDRSALLEEAFSALDKQMIKALDKYAEEASKKFQEVRNTALTLLEEINKEAQDAAAESLSPEAVLRLQYDRTIASLTEKKDELQKAFNEGTITETEYFRGIQQIDFLMFAANKKLEKQINDLENTVKNSKLNGIDSKIAEIFNLSDEQYLAFKEQVINNINLVVSEITAITDAQIDENDRLIDSIKERRERVEEELDRELRAAELGYANNVGAKKKELEEIAKEEKKAQDKAAKLAKQRARQQLAIDAARQASGLATTAINIFTNESLKGVAGYIFALAAVGTLFSTFASIKKQAAAATVPTRLYKGGPVRDFGMIQERGGRSDVPGRNSGHMVEGTNLMLGGREFVTKEEVSREHKGFLTHLNENPHLYRGHDLQDLFLRSKTFDYDRINRDFRHDRKIISYVSRKRQEENVSKAIVEAIKEQTLQLLPAIKDGEQLFIDNGKLITVTKNRSGKSIQIKAIKG